MFIGFNLPSAVNLVLQITKKPNIAVMTYRVSVSVPMFCPGLGTFMLPPSLFLEAVILLCCVLLTARFMEDNVNLQEATR